MRTFALTAVGTDRPGIVAAVAERLAAFDVNVTDSEMAILAGHFAMMLIVTGADGLDADALGRELEEVGEALRLDLISLREVSTALTTGAPAPTFVVSVYGADHPGILAAITQALVEGEVNICDLKTRLLGEERERPLYVMLMEVAVPEGMSQGQLEALLVDPAGRANVEATVQPLEQDIF